VEAGEGGWQNSSLTKPWMVNGSVMERAVGSSYKQGEYCAGDGQAKQ
jgi:hypothetical protein